MRTPAEATYVNDYIWRRSLLGALACREIGKSLARRDLESFFLAGLMQDIGVLALQAALPKRYGEITSDRPVHATIVQRERQAFGFDHAYAGSWLMSHWNLPDYLVSAVSGSHVTGRDSDCRESNALPAAVALASLVAELFVSDDDQIDPQVLASDAQRLLNLDGDAVAQILDRVSAHIPETEVLFETSIVSASYAAGVVDQAREILMMRQLEMIRQIADRERQVRKFEESSRKWQETAHRDWLTGISNRWHFDQRLEEEFALARDNKWPLAVVFVDLDHFKSINDQHGHVDGDRVLAEAAQLLADNLRESDFIARYGGEEFIALMPGTGPKDAVTIAERLRNALAANRFVSNDGRTIHVTASIGLTVFEPAQKQVDSPSELVREADFALYQAKANGRNRVEQFHHNGANSA